MEKQATFGSIVGMEPAVPTRLHGDDFVECSDGTLVRHRDVCYDCRGGVHSSDEDCHEANVTIVTEILDEEDRWVCEYCTENDDYASGYDYVVSEGAGSHADCIKEWVDATYYDYSDSMEATARDVILEHASREGYDSDSEFDEAVDIFCNAVTAEKIALEMSGEFDDFTGYCDLVYNFNEYASYNGKGCCFASIEIGEYENQLELSRHEELTVLHEQGALDDILDDVNSDAYVSRSRRREKNEETGLYEYVGRETYDPYGSDYPDLMTYHMPGGQWHWVVSEDDMEEMFRNAICQLFQNWW